MIDVLVNEHTYIKIVLKAVKKISLGLVNGNEVDDEMYRNIIDFVRNYADKYHHQKEENYLFNKMAGPENNTPAQGPVQGMLLEHDMGRKYISNLEKALDEYKAGNKEAKVNIISYGVVYADLLEDHIHKEDNVIYKYALRVLTEEETESLGKEFEKIEEKTENTVTRNKYIAFAENLKNTFNL